MLQNRSALTQAALALVLALASPAAAQRYHVHTYTEGDGLPSSTVRGMTQDAAGRMWFATRAGISVYDGRDWRRFPTGPDGLPKTNWHRQKNAGTWAEKCWCRPRMRCKN